MRYKRLGDYIQLVDNRNTDGKITNLLGVNITNNFMPTVANKSGLDLTKYKIVSRGVFATNIMHVGRDERLPIALYEADEPALISPAYKTFKVIDENKLIPEYLMIEFHRHEFHRLAWFFCDSSIRGGLDWERFCEIKIPVHDIEEQKKYVDIYNGLLNNQKLYGKSLDDLQLICNAYLENLSNETKLEYMGKYIELTDERNTNGEITNILGVNINKEYMPSKAKVKSLLKYKIIRKGDFAANVMHVGRDEILPVALYSSNDPAIVSPAYKTFRLKSNSALSDEFLMLWFYRSEFDRLTWYYCDSSVRGGLDWERFCEITVPVPDMEVQKSIITIYNTLQTRKRINEQLKDTIKPLCTILIKCVMDTVIEPGEEEVMM
jgi:type I restriction enzyme S subunit